MEFFEPSFFPSFIHAAEEKDDDDELTLILCVTLQRFAKVMDFAKSQVEVYC